MSYLTQMAGLTVHNFVSAAAGIVLAVALIRVSPPFGEDDRQFLGRYDPLRFLHPLPISIIGALLLCWQGVPQNLGAYNRGTTPKAPSRSSPKTGRLAGDHQGARHQRRRFLQRQFGASLENPTPLSNLIEMVAIFAIASG